MLSHCKHSQITSLKLYLIVTLVVNFKHNFHKENETFSPKKLKRFKEKCLKMEPFLSELPYHIYDWLIISLKDFCIVIRKWPTFLLPSRSSNDCLQQCLSKHILTKAYESTRKKNNHKFRHIAVNTSQHRQSFSSKTVGPWNQLSFADSPTFVTLESFLNNLLSTNRP